MSCELTGSRSTHFTNQCDTKKWILENYKLLEPSVSIVEINLFEAHQCMISQMNCLQSKAPILSVKTSRCKNLLFYSGDVGDIINVPDVMTLLTFTVVDTNAAALETRSKRIARNGLELELEWLRGDSRWRSSTPPPGSQLTRLGLAMRRCSRCWCNSEKE